MIIEQPSTSPQGSTRRATWLSEALDRIGELPCGYSRGGPPSAEPTALAALALAIAGKHDAARNGLNWLSSLQQSDGRIVPQMGLKWPGWPTSMALVAATALRDKTHLDSDNRQQPFATKALEWLLLAAGTPLRQSTNFGHDVRLVGWSWADATHSWVEPTAWSVLALKAWGMSNHPRTREGVRLLVDRLLDTGGCNYGNTLVLGQRLRPHVEPSGLAMLALADEELDDPRIELTLRYLTSATTSETTPVSLSYAILGLSALGRRPTESEVWLASAFRDVLQRDSSPHKIALLTLACLDEWPTSSERT